MLLNQSFHDNIDENRAANLPESAMPLPYKSRENVKSKKIRIISEKIRIPQQQSQIFSRSRLIEWLSVQTGQFGASMILGRAGTGKTTLAVEFAGKYEFSAWFRIESADSDWEVFSNYFTSSLRNVLPDLEFKHFAPGLNQNRDSAILNFLEDIFFHLEKKCLERKFLIVLDDLHGVFDAKWFEIFFKGLLSYENPNIHFLLLSRSKPPFPLWRLRSKQKLGILEESLLLFTVRELEDLFQKNTVSKNKIARIHKRSFGRISKILEFYSSHTVK